MLITINYGDYCGDGHGLYESYVVDSPVYEEILETLIEKIIESYDLSYLMSSDYKDLKLNEDTFDTLVNLGFSMNKVIEYCELGWDYHLDEFNIKHFTWSEEKCYINISFIHLMIKFLLGVEYGIYLKNAKMRQASCSLGYGSFI